LGLRNACGSGRSKERRRCLCLIARCVCRFVLRGCFVFSVLFVVYKFFLSFFVTRNYPSQLLNETNESNSYLKTISLSSLCEAALVVETGLGEKVFFSFQPILIDYPLDDIAPFYHRSHSYTRFRHQRRYPSERSVRRAHLYLHKRVS